MFSVKCFLFAAMLALALPEHVRANPTETAVVRKVAEQGDASAQHNLGVMYQKGAGVLKDVRTELTPKVEAARLELARARRVEAIAKRLIALAKVPV